MTFWFRWIFKLSSTLSLNSGYLVTFSQNSQGIERGPASLGFFNSIIAGRNNTMIVRTVIAIVAAKIYTL